MRKILPIIFGFLVTSFAGAQSAKEKYSGPIFDTHFHGHFVADKREAEVKALTQNHVTQCAITVPFNTKNFYPAGKNLKFIYGMMLPCPNGKVPYGGPSCFENGAEYPDVNWVRQQIEDHKIDYLGELVNQYYGISPSDSTMFPYYGLAQEFDIPVTIHTGLAGPDHGCPNFDPKMGDPALLRAALQKFPKLRVSLMHAGMPYLDGTLDIMKTFSHIYADISVIANPDIVPQEGFAGYMKALIDAGLENQLMFGSDNGDVAKMIDRVNTLAFLTKAQKEKIFRTNAEKFFRSN